VARRLLRDLDDPRDVLISNIRESRKYGASQPHC